MKTYSFSEIENKHGQRIYNFSKQPGITELDKCINFINAFGSSFKRFDTRTIDGQDITCIVTEGDSFEVFNSVGEKVGEYDSQINERVDYKITCVEDILTELEDLGFEI